MAHHNTVFRQLLDLLPRHEFDTEARQHQKGQRRRVMSRWAQFVALGLGQLAGLQSLRDIVSNLCAQPHKLYHLGVQAFVSRAELDPAPNATGSPAQLVRPSSTGGAVHDALATGSSKPSDAAVVLKNVGQQ